MKKNIIKTKEYKSDGIFPKHSKNPFYDKKKLLLEIIPLMLFIIMCIIGFYVYPALPDKIPTHWNAAGEIDSYGPKAITIFIVPIMYLVFIIFAFLLPAMDVFKENIKGFYNYYYAMKILFGLFFLALYLLTIMPNFGYKFNMSTVIISSVIILFFALGYILRHVKRNFFIGIRTPWTLASEKVWDKTHDVGGIAFMSFSIIMLICLAFLKPTYIFIAFIVLLLIMVVSLTLYSYILYRREQNL